MNKLYCPICRYEVLEEYPIEGEEEFCQNCLAWSFVCIDSDSGEFYLEFSRFDNRNA